MERPDCLHPTNCKAKTPGKHCHPCMMTARNRSSKQREVARQARLKNPTLPGDATRKSWEPEAKAKRSKTMTEKQVGWCPPEYREYNQQLRQAKILLPERKRLVAELAQAEGRKKVREYERQAREKEARRKAQEY